MNSSLISQLTGATDSLSKLSNMSGIDLKTGQATDGTLFDSFLNTAIDNLSTTNSYLSDAENAEIAYALGETDSTHDLTVALEKASIALQYTVAIRDKVLEAYKSIMQMQI